MNTIMKDTVLLQRLCSCFQQSTFLTSCWFISLCTDLFDWISFSYITDVTLASGVIFLKCFDMKCLLLLQTQG